MFQLDNKPLALDVPFTHNEISYPANWLRLASPEERAAIGITEVADAESYDDRFYWGVGNPKQLEDISTFPEGSDVSVVESKGLKSHWIAQIKDTANKMMQPTDWMVWRAFERQVAIPEAVVLKRAAILAEANRLEEAIEACTTVAELADVVAAQNWGE